MTTAKLFRFTEDDLSILARVKKRYGFASESQAVRMALRQMNESSASAAKLPNKQKTGPKIISVSADRVNTLIGLTSVGGDALQDSESLYE